MTVNAEFVRTRLTYDPDTGIMRWRVPAGLNGRIPAGTVAGNRHHRGFLRVTIDNRMYQIHRLIWLYVHGEWPKNQIDHINRNPADNRLCNLRDVTAEVNLANRAPYRIRGLIRDPGNPLLLGTTFHKRARKWQAQRRGRYLGMFPTPEAAHAAYVADVEMNP